LLDVEALKRRQTELVTENKSLRDGVKTMQRQLQWMLRLLASWGLLSMTGPHWTMRGNNQLMIQGGPGKAEVEEATDFDTLTDSLSDHDSEYSSSSLFGLLQYSCSYPVRTLQPSIHCSWDSYSGIPQGTKQSRLYRWGSIFATIVVMGFCWGFVPIDWLPRISL
jgi:hypothetical protein